MDMKPDSKTCSIREQVIEDPVTGLTLQFEIVPSGETRLHVFGGVLEFGNRTYMFDAEGKEAGAGTSLTGLCKPSWVQQVDEL